MQDSTVKISGKKIVNGRNREQKPGVSRQLGMTKVVEAVDARQASGPDKIIEDTAGAPVRQALAALIQRFGDTP